VKGQDCPVLHAEIGMITHLSIAGAETLGRPNGDVNGGKPLPSAPGFMRWSSTCERSGSDIRHDNYTLAAD
jgi:hypothetical protein